MGQASGVPGLVESVPEPCTSPICDALFYFSLQTSINTRPALTAHGQPA
jgi:hypothetical protein